MTKTLKILRDLLSVNEVKMNIFEQKYDGESLCDVDRDISEAFDTEFNPMLENVPQDKYGFKLGTFTIKIEWSIDDDIKVEPTFKCSICGSTENVKYMGGHQPYLCDSEECIPF